MMTNERNDDEVGQVIGGPFDGAGVLVGKERGNVCWWGWSEAHKWRWNVTHIDLGLGHRAAPRLRLRGIDCPEPYTQAGQQAAAFVRQALPSASLVVITTRRTDIYGRYLADLKYLPGATDPRAVLADGTYLNRQLLDESLAVRYLA